MSETLSRMIRQRMEKAGGWLPFDVFMHEALYAPDSGYYESAEVFGEAGDFVTGPGMGPWLAHALADLLLWGWQQMGRPAGWCLVEQGSGNGRLLRDVVFALENTDCAMPARIISVEASELMRERQRECYLKAGMEVIQRSTLSGIPRQAHCLLFCNELVDAFPVRCFSWRHESMLERGVCWRQGGFSWQERALEHGPTIDRKLMQAWPEGYVSEWNPLLASWLAQVRACMRRGYVFCVDYGYAQSEYYRSQRREGTLLAHLRHQAVEDVLCDPGSRDITAHVDFTALVEEGARLGFETCCWMSQGAWLAQSPSVQAMVRHMAQRTDTEAMQAMAGARRMMMPQGMGELFKLCALALHASRESPPYLVRFDRKDALAPRRS